MPSERKKNTLPPPTDIDYVTPPKDNLIEELRFTLDNASSLYADIAWDFVSALKPTTIYAHKAILYSRSSRSFQERFLKNKDTNGMSIRSVRLSNPEPLIVKADEDPIMFRQELKFFYTGEEGSEEFLAAVDTTDELEQDKLKEDLLYMFKSKLYTDVELILDHSDNGDLDIAMLSSNFKDSKTASIRLDASIFNNTSLNLILTYIYTGNLTSHSKPLTLETCEWVWIGADFLGIKGLCDDCVHKISTKAHYFTCTCAECQVVIPSIAIFAKEHDVKKLWKGCMHVLTKGFDNMWPQKTFADLDEETREEVCLTLLSSIQNNNIISIFKGCRKVISTIDIKGIGLPWIETIRNMTNQVKSFTTKILVDNFDQLCNEDQEFLDCVDGVGFSSDLLEDIMKIVLQEGLTEQNSARIIKCITTKLLTRPAVINAESIETKRILVQAKQHVFDYIKKHWLGVKQYGGFRLLSPWLLDEFSKELNVTNQELQEPINESQLSLLSQQKQNRHLQDQKAKARAPSVTNGISTKAKNAATNGNSNGNSSTNKKTNNNINGASSSSSTTTSPAKKDTNGTSSTTTSLTKKGKSVRIAGTTTPSTPSSSFARPTRASVLRQKALEEAKNPTRSSMLRQMKYDETEQRRGRDKNLHHRRKKSPSSQASRTTSITSVSNGKITSMQPKPHQTKLATISNPDISVGRRIILPTKNNSPGTIQFLGETEFAKGIWVGIELDNPVGKNNGTVANIKYFVAVNSHGIFVRPDSILLI
ncbi:10958_t:CDS:2 [Entrophospora sp. SA101]|nr:10958_t:CDS:2 [Entrophospora sp. SA101]CAJ0910018.1 16580_t:CDS:2 [Entrophospora sp. SA101]